MYKLKTSRLVWLNLVIVGSDTNSYSSIYIRFNIAIQWRLPVLCENYHLHKVQARKLPVTFAKSFKFALGRQAFKLRIL